MSELSHVREDGSPQMVDISGKAITTRKARCEGFLRLKPPHLEALDALPKGDALTVAVIAGIQGGKRCSELIPLCHPVSLSKLDVQIHRESDGLRIVSEATTDAQTGVEMEAYTAVVVAGVTLIDMLKGVDPDLELTRVRMLEKTGGKRPWSRNESGLEHPG
jgi:cyclic pyranopterin monophosphate synthase